MNNLSNLRNRSLYLFTEEEMNPRQDANRDEVLAAFTPMANGIVGKILEANNDYLRFAEAHPIARRENTFCSSNMHGLIIESLSQIEGIRTTGSSSGNSFLKIGDYEVWVKKLDEKGMPFVNGTKSSTKRICQKADGPDTLPMLILGFKLDERERLTCVHLLYLNEFQHIWTPIDLGDIAASHYTQLATGAPEDEPIVTVKAEKQRGRETV